MLNAWMMHGIFAKGEEIKYALVASVETAEQTSTTIYDEVKMALRTRARDHVRGRVQG